MKVPILMIFIWLWANCLDSSKALFFKTLKGLKHGYNYGGYGDYPAGYSNNYNAAYAYGGYGGGGYGGAGSYGGYGGYGNYGKYGGYTRPSKKKQRTGRTFSEIQRVLYNNNNYLGIGSTRYLPRTPYSHLWG